MIIDTTQTKTEQHIVRQNAVNYVARLKCSVGFAYGIIFGGCSDSNWDKATERRGKYLAAGGER